MTFALGHEVPPATWASVLGYALEVGADPAALLAALLAGETSGAVGLTAHRTRGRARWAEAA